jgi:hypothetical protein
MPGAVESVKRRRGEAHRIEPEVLEHAVEVLAVQHVLGARPDNASPRARLAATRRDRRARDDLGHRVNALPYVGVHSYNGHAAARYVLCIRKEVLAMFTNRQTPPGVAL